MRNTIGELINDILPYTNLIECGRMKPFPFFKAHLIDSNGFVCSYIYIIQTDEGVYSLAETNDELHGKRFIVSGNSLVREIDMVRSMNGRRSVVDEDENVVRGITRSQFIDYFYQIIFQYNIPKISRRDFFDPISNLKFSSARITRSIENICSACHRDTTIKDMLLIVKDPIQKFDLSSMKEKDFNEMKKKFSQLGLCLDIRDRLVVDMYLETRYQDIEKKKYSSK